MPEEMNDVAANVMKQIAQGKIKMRPRIYFIIGSVLSFAGLVSAILTLVFLAGLARFYSRPHGPMGEYRLERILASFPWWSPVIALLGLAIGIWLLRKYSFSYKHNINLIVIGAVIAIIFGGWLVDVMGLNDNLFRRGPIRDVMRQSQDGSPEIGHIYGRRLNAR